MKEVQIYTDGACSGNPGPGGWGAILVFGGREKELSGGEIATTNNRMELSGAIEALRALKEPCRVTLTSDSKYLGQKAGRRADGSRRTSRPHSIPICGKSCLPCWRSTT